MSSSEHKTIDTLLSINAPKGQHLAAISPSKGSALELVYRKTPTPGPTDLLISVSAIALNPIDFYQRDFGRPTLAGYPSVLGSDIGGTVVAVGSAVSPSAPKVGSRVAAFAVTFFRQGAPDWGAFQKLALVPAVMAVEIPESMSFNEASLIPMSIVTAWAGWYSIGLPKELSYKAAANQGVLVWGGASSVGSGTLQTAKLMGYTVYTAAGEKHHEYLKSLGASRCFDYKQEDVVAQIVKAAKDDGLTIQIAYDAVGSLQSCFDVVKELKGDLPGKIASAPRISDDSPKVEGIEAKFASAPQDEVERREHFNFVFGVWLKDKLGKGEYVPSPKIQVVGKGLGALQNGVDLMRAGVSGVKLVVEVD
jgi:NADPH:quinone reductase-like Zn-dependent oxidoreductase